MYDISRLRVNIDVLYVLCWIAGLVITTAYGVWQWRTRSFARVVQQIQLWTEGREKGDLGR
jgi:hypothetical protein